MYALMAIDCEELQARQIYLFGLDHHPDDLRVAEPWFVMELRYDDTVQDPRLPQRQ